MEQVFEPHYRIIPHLYTSFNISTNKNKSCILEESSTTSNKWNFHKVEKFYWTPLGDSSIQATIKKLEVMNIPI